MQVKDMLADVNADQREFVHDALLYLDQTAYRSPAAGIGLAISLCLAGAFSAHAGCRF